MPVANHTNHLSSEDWDQLVLGAPTNEASAHLDECVQCRSVSDRLSRDASPGPALSGVRANSGAPKWPWIALSLVFLAAAAGYAHAFLAVRAERDDLMSHKVHLDAQLVRQRTELDVLKKLQTPMLSSAPQSSSAETESLRDSLRKFQLQASQVAEQHKALEAIRAQFRELEQRAKGDADRLAAIRSEYEAKLRSKEEALTKVAQELQETRSELAKADPTESATALQEQFSILAQASGDPALSLTDTGVSIDKPRGMLTLTTDPLQLKKVKHILETQGRATLFLGCKRGDRACLNSRQKCETSTECVRMRVDFAQDVYSLR
ncbi:MAG TPA: hypothetical protein VEQ15_02635 [Myxococcales bacterium]|nr:hypothetical protein [Myxococcales bacterium]HZD85875.1 hypothetical protein [Gemmatimonadaceae bacterium]